MSRCDRCDMDPCQCPAIRRDDARRQREASARRTLDTSVRTIAAVYPGTCPICHGEIVEGQEIGKTIAGAWAHARWTDHDDEGLP